MGADAGAGVVVMLEDESGDWVWRRVKSDDDMRVMMRVLWLCMSGELFFWARRRTE